MNELKNMFDSECKAASIDFDASDYTKRDDTTAS